MSVNTSTYSSGSHLHFHFLSINSFTFEPHCLNANAGYFIFTTFTIINILLLLPLCIFVLYHGFQRWRKQRFAFTAAMTTHSDTFTYHLVIMELINISGCILCCCGMYLDIYQTSVVWYYLFSITWYGETFYHLLTCVEHYMAVVHPITYLSLKKARAIRIRNIAIGCIWLLCFGLTIILIIENSYITVDLCLTIISVIIISFCSLSVLYVLIHPGPGDLERNQTRIHQSKQRAFYTIVAILGVLLLRCIYFLVLAVLSALKTCINVCVPSLSAVWINFPSSLVLPLLYLNRTEMLACCQNNRK